MGKGTSGKANGHSARTSALTSAAAALDAELARYVGLSANAARAPLTSEAGIARASSAIVEAAECERLVMLHVKALLEAINGAREMQESSTKALNERADAVAQRRAELDALLARFEKLGEVGKTLNAALQKVVGYKPDPYADGAEATEVRAALEAIANGMVTCAEHAQALATDAHAREFEDLARQADGLRQQILSAKNRLSLVQKGMTA